jgi:hypothetical protein
MHLASIMNNILFKNSKELSLLTLSHFHILSPYGARKLTAATTAGLIVQFVQLLFTVCMFGWRPDFGHKND